ncbi:DNA polymerase III, epsilon subunit [Stackebrandtia soli]
MTFTVVDLETTGIASDASAITEIGAVKVRGGEILGEFSTLVNPGEPISPRISAMTGITDAMVADAPPIAAVLPSFLEFAAGSTWVAHNAPFDVGFLRAACESAGQPWPRPAVVDTVVLARRLLDRSEVPNRRLGTLARHFGAAVTPNHRALDDAKATVDVLHALLERLGGHYVVTDVDLAEFQRAIPAEEQRRKRHLAEGLPQAPGVYIFRDAADKPLYIGTSVNIAGRVRGYFTGSEKRTRMRHMLRLAERVETIECAHRVEAQVRELRLISGTKPPFNRKSKYPERLSWLRLTNEAFPRLSVVRTPPEAGAHWLGPFTSRRLAEETRDAVLEAVPIRQCTTKLSVRSTSPACALAELGCLAPCQHRVDVDEYGEVVARLGTAIAGDPSTVVAALQSRIGDLAARERFESAAELRRALRTFLHTVTRTQRLRAFIDAGELVAAERAPHGGWDVAVIRHGQLAAADTTPARTNPMQAIQALRSSAATIPATDAQLAGVRAAEAELLLSWLERPEVRLVHADVGWSMPTRSAGSYHALLDRLRDADVAAGVARY